MPRSTSRPTAWHLLEVLARQPSRLVASLDLLRAVWGSAYGEESRHYLRVYMAQLRRKLEPDPAAPRHRSPSPAGGYRSDTLRQPTVDLHDRSPTRDQKNSRGVG